MKPQPHVLMAHPRHYQPAISRALICALYHEGKHRRQPMTKLVEQLLVETLSGTTGWQKAMEQYPDEMPHLIGDLTS